MALKVYSYKNCGTCKKALKFLDGHGVDYREVAIREHPPSQGELKRMLRYVEGDLRKLFNTSGGDYKSLHMKDRLPTMTEPEALELLASNGNLVKRPFVLGTDTGSVGFKEEEWREKYL